MISLEGVVNVVLWLLLAVGVFGLLYLLIWLVSTLFDEPLKGTIRKFGLIVLGILAILLLLGLLLSYIRGQMLFRP